MAKNKSKKKKKSQTPSGMHDILPKDQNKWQYFWKTAEEVSSNFGFRRIDTPILEFTELFEKGTGKDTDIVQKEMFSLRTKGGDRLTLRPEGTPSIARAFIQHGMKKWTAPIKLYYVGPMFRHEKPQRGRFRQFYQFGLETIGEDDPARDVEIINIVFKILEKLKINEVTLEINSIGCLQCRAKYIKNLKFYYRYKLRQICADCRKRYKDNPLRLLDCEEEKCQRTQSDAPQMLDFLCSDCNAHFKKVLDILDYIEIPYLLNPRLVRGLDYYTRTVFEIFEGGVVYNSENEKNGKKKLAIASGGRYDNLVKFLGGTDTPAVGVAIGAERVLSILDKNNKGPRRPRVPRVFIVQLGDKAKKKSFKIMDEFIKAGIPVREAIGRDSISAQLKLANRFKTDLAIILGQKEVLDKVVIVREMDSGTQEIIPEEKLIKEVKKRLKRLKGKR